MKNFNRFNGVSPGVRVAGAFAVLALFLMVSLFGCGEGAKEDTAVEVVKKAEPEESEEIKEKRRTVEEHLRARYKIDDTTSDGKEGTNPGIELTFAPDGFLEKMVLRGEFTPPIDDRFSMPLKNYLAAKEVRALTDEFLDREKELFGLSNLEDDIGEGDIRIRPYKSTFEDVVYNERYVEGVRLPGYSVIFYISKEDGAVRRINANLRPVTPEMVAAIKEYRAEGLIEDDIVLRYIDANFKPLTPEMVAAIKEYRAKGYTKDDIDKIVLDDLVKRGLDKERIKEFGVTSIHGYAEELQFIDEAPYVIWGLEVYYCYERREAFLYTFNALTGEFINREVDEAAFEEASDEEMMCDEDRG